MNNPCFRSKNSSEGRIAAAPPVVDNRRGSVVNNASRALRFESDRDSVVGGLYTDNVVERIFSALPLET